MDAFQRFHDRCGSFDIDSSNIVGIATSASRRAANAPDFFARVEAETGIRVRIVSGLEEAQLTWKGALLGLPIDDLSYAVIDLGGGSTEIVTGDLNQAASITPRSLEIGTVRLTEAFFGSRPSVYDFESYVDMRTHIATHLRDVDWRTIPSHIIAVAGTATTLGAMELGLQHWDRNLVHGTHLQQSALLRWIDRLLHSTSEQRVEWAAVSPERADYLLAGASVLESICEAAGRNSLWVSDGGVRHGAMMVD